MSREHHHPSLPDAGVLLTDFYQLTMLQGYFDRGMEETAVFEFFVRKLPPRRGFLMAAWVTRWAHEETITFPAGNHHEVIRIGTRDFLGRTGAQVVEFCEGE